MSRIAAFFATIVLTAIASVASADPPCVRHPGPPPFLECPRIVVDGRPQGPSGSLIVPRSRDRRAPPALSRDLSREIARTVRRPPF